MRIKIFQILFFLFFVTTAFSQIVINEVVSSNIAGITDEDGEFVDWIELYNNSGQSVNLEGFIINDRNNPSNGWELPAVELASKSFILLYASGKDRKDIAINYRTIIDRGDNWQYKVPQNGTIDSNWRLPGFNATGWQTGASGFGYGDGDDNTIIQPLQSIYLRKTFQIENPDVIQKILLHVDYDDGFVAFINGKTVALGNTYLPNPSDLENVTVNSDHEALIYQEGIPEKFEIDASEIQLYKGENIIAIQGYNISEGSSDFSLIPIITIGSITYTSNKLSQYIGQIGEGGMHTDFSINKDGETIYLFNKNKQLIDSLQVVALESDISYGRYPDGNNSYKYFPTPSPGENNTNGIDEIRNDKVIFSHPSGFYKQTININLSTNANDVSIRYTTDGSSPNNSSKIYNQSITISKNTVIRAATFYMGQRSGDIFSSSFFINSEHQLPVVSISTEPDNLFDYNEGILVEGPNAQAADPKYGANYWMDWEKPVNIEYFDIDKQQQINQPAGIKIFGGWSRMNAQKSMAVYARNSYGNNRFQYPLFADRKSQEYKAFLLRNSGNDWYYAMLRDAYVSEVVKSTDVDRLAYQPSVVYLNGEYWGILNLREKPNEHYLAANHGVNPNDVNRLEGNRSVIQGNGLGYNQIVNFVQNHELQTENDYNRIADQIDVSCFIDYQLTEIYVNNRDWPGNNIKYWNTNKPYSKWRWILYDTDFGLNLYGYDEHSENTIEFATEAYSTSWPNPEWSTLLLRKMLSNENFKNQFINRLADLMNTVFAPEFMNYKLDSIVAMIRPEIEDHKNKWGHSYYEWEYSVDAIYRFNENRPNYMRAHIIDYFGLSGASEVSLNVSNNTDGHIQINTIVPETYPFRGMYFNNIPIGFKALPKPGYRFVKWENASSSTNSEISLTINGPTQLKAIFEPVYSDEKAIVINEINYRSHPDYDSGEWIELYNNSEQTINLNGWKISDEQIYMAYTFTEKDVIYPKGFLVLTADRERFLSVHPKTKPISGDFIFGLSSQGETISLFDNNNQLIDFVNYQSSLPWPTEPLINPVTIELSNPAADRQNASNWKAGPFGGSPGEPNSIRTSTNEYKTAMHAATCFPTRFADYTTLRFYSQGISDYSITITDMQGRTNEIKKGKLLHEGTHYIDIFVGDNFQRGIYAIQIQTLWGVENINVIKQ